MVMLTADKDGDEYISICVFFFSICIRILCFKYFEQVIEIPITFKLLCYSMVNLTTLSIVGCCLVLKSKKFYVH